jgi:glycosyltransferase involved in cell wall biosynthesis
VVSVIVPVWNPRREWLRAAVASALSQASCEIELIVVDDGCPEPVDGSLQGLNDRRLRLVRVEHGGVARARNAGLAVARGDAVRFLDADDAFEPGSSARLAALARNEHDVIAYGATMLCDAELRPRRKIVCELEGDVLTDCLLGRFTVRLPAMLFPRYVVDAVGEFDPAFELAEDGDWVLRALEHARVRGESATAAFYRRHRGSVTEDIAKGEAGLRLMIERHFERHPRERDSRLHRRARAWVDIIAAQARSAHGDYPGSARRFVSALRRDPPSAIAAIAREVRRVGARAGRRVRRVASAAQAASRRRR